MGNFFQELKRRKVFRVAALYAVVAWIIMQIGEVTFPALLLPDWTLTLVIVLLILGFPVALVLAWAFDVTPQGIVRDQNALATPLDTSIVPSGSISPGRFFSTPAVRNTFIGVGALVLAGAAVLYFRTSAVFGRSASVPRNSLAILNFENLQDAGDSSRLGQILQELIITDLSGNDSLQVFSSQRLFDAQKQIGYKDRRVIDPAAAIEVARSVGAGTILTGNIIQTPHRTILTSRLVEVENGTVLKSQRVEGSDLYTMVDELTDLVRRDLKITSSAAAAVALQVREKTSSSMTAYQHYLEGVDLFNDQKFEQAIGEFKNAVAVDSTFSRAYYKMAMAQWWWQSISGEFLKGQALEELNYLINNDICQNTKEKLLVQGALALINQDFSGAQKRYRQLVTFLPDEKEGWYGLGEAAFHGTKDYDQALEAFSKVLEFDPEFILAYRHIFDIYAMKEMFVQGKMRALQFATLYPENPWSFLYLGRMQEGNGEIDPALESYNRAIELNPEFGEAYQLLAKVYINHDLGTRGVEHGQRQVARYPQQHQPYTMLGALYRSRGEYDQALRLLRDGLLMNPKVHELKVALGMTCQAAGDYRQAEEIYSEMIAAEAPEPRRYTGYTLLSSLYREQGLYQQALQLLEVRRRFVDSADRDRMGNEHLLYALVSSAAGDTISAHARLDSALALDASIYIDLVAHFIRCYLYGRLGQVQNMAEVVRLVQNLRDQGTRLDQRENQVIQAILYQYYALTGDSKLATVQFGDSQEARALKDWTLYAEAQYHLNRGDYSRALAAAERMQSPRLSWDARPFLYPRGYYVKGLIYEASGKPDLAREQYRRLLSLWKNADPGIRELVESRRRLAGVGR